MPVFELGKELSFPHPSLADRSGLLAYGGDLSPQRVLLAYQQGIFPWFNPEDPVLWWSPDPRFVLFPNRLKVSKSLRQVLRQGRFQITFDQDFLGVVSGCRHVPRHGQAGTWISDDIIRAYNNLHQQGFIHSVEVRLEGKLVGGLYGGCFGKCFYGESMFSHKSNASKAGFATLVRNLEAQGFELVDCQVHTPHLESLGAEKIPRDLFLEINARNVVMGFKKTPWDGLFQTRFDW